MARLPLKADTLRALFAKSGNICTFPGCTHELVTEQNLFVGQVCHIEAANPEGPRFNPESTDEDRRHYGNLILLCYRHHKEVDQDVERYSEKTLRKIKAEHESTFGRKIFKVDESVVYQIEREGEVFWKEIQRLQKEEHPVPELAVEIDTGVSPIELFNKVRKAVARAKNLTNLLCESDNELDSDLRSFLSKLGYALEPYETIKCYENPFQIRNWEIHNLGIPNAFIDLYVLLMQIEVKYIG